MKAIIYVCLLYTGVLYSQSWYIDSREKNSSLKQILKESFRIEENQEDTIYVKVDDITNHFNTKEVEEFLSTEGGKAFKFPYYRCK